MQRESWKIFLVCAFGAGIGSFVALEVAKTFWWIGLIVGGLTGYIGYDVRAAARAVPAAFRAAWAWESASYALRGFFWLQLAFAVMMFWPATLITSLGLLTHRMSIKEFFFWDMTFVGILTGIGAFLRLLAFLLAGIDGDWSLERDGAKGAQRIIYRFAPPLVIFWHLPRGIFFTLRTFARFARRFGWEFFVRIHSEKRLLCGMDAMLGAAVGYFVGSALIGAAAGGIFGVLNYAIVTERWLKPRGYLPLRS